MSRPRKLNLPPRLRNPSGLNRRIGVELEFAALSAQRGAELVQSLFGGQMEEVDPHCHLVRNTRLGDFRSELDSQYAHRPPSREVGAPEEAVEDTFFSRFEEQLRKLFGDLGSLVLPCEIVCPPIEFDKLQQLDELVEALNQAGAAGTRSHLLYAFGAQLNPEIAEGDEHWVVAVCKAYLLLSDWLRAIMGIDFTRRMAAFAEPFPTEYTLLVVDPSYWPDRAQFLDDYVRFNPTRNRELDLLPLFTWWDEDRIRNTVMDSRVKPRPAFHYRLPDANINQSDWGLILEWNRWCAVERLAERRDLLDRMGTAYHQNQSRLIPENWAIRASEWLVIALA